MTPKKILKISTDIAMLGLIFFLMSYPLTRGLMRHAICGIALFAFFMTHHLLNLRWHMGLFRGRYGGKRIFAAAADIMLCAATLAMATSSLLMAGDVFAFAPFPMTWWARSLHATSAAWLFALSGLHLGLRWKGLWKLGSVMAGRGWLPLAAIFMTYGLWNLAQSNLLSAMFLLDDGKAPPASLESFILRHVVIFLFFCLLANFPTTILQKKGIINAQEKLF